MNITLILLAEFKGLDAEAVKGIIFISSSRTTQDSHLIRLRVNLSLKRLLF